MGVLANTVLVLLSLNAATVFCQSNSVVHDDGHNCFGETNSRPRQTTVKDLIKSSDTFSMNFFTDVALRNPVHNIISSPYSLWAVLRLAYLGANTNTRVELGNALGIVDAYDAYNNFNALATRLSQMKGIEFSQMNQASMDNTIDVRQCLYNKLSDVEKLDFGDQIGAVNKLNKDVSLATRGKITDFLKEDDLRNVKFVLINAVYFKGKWVTAFDATLTSERSFFHFDGKTPVEKVQMMRINAKPTPKFKYVNSAKLQAEFIILPYQGAEKSESNVGMLFVLPNRDVTVDAVLKKLTSDVVDQTVANMRVQPVDVTIPKFEMTVRMAQEVRKTLANMGVSDLFDSRTADLSLLADSKPGERPLYVQAALHHATIEVDEEGTVATAASGLVGTRSGATTPLIFNANRPFAFFIRDNVDGLTLFAGVFREVPKVKSPKP